jgi:F-type H+-transporting ATPase subunit b
MITIPILAISGAEFAQQVKDTGAEFGFHWPLFLSQCASLIIVAILLQKFAYKPIIAVLEQRRAQIAESIENAAKIKQQLAEAEQRHSEILKQASVEAQRIIDEARSASATLAERRTQQAIAEAGQIIAKAREAITIEKDKMMTELRREVGRLVVETTSKVAGKVLTADDHRRLSEETARQIAA